MDVRRRFSGLWLKGFALALLVGVTPARGEEPVQDDAFVPATIEIGAETDATLVLEVAGGPTEGGAVLTVTGEGAESAAQEPSTGANPTHKQSALVEINGEGREQATVKCFCLAGERLLAGCEGTANEIRVFDADGKFVEAIAVPVTPEAINVAPDGSILVAGDGRLLRIGADGAELASAEAPHAAAMRENSEQLRQEVVEQHKQQVTRAPQMLEAYDQAIKTLEEQIAALGDDEERAAERKTAEETIEAYRSAREQMAEQAANQEEAAELTEEEIDKLVEASIGYKMEVASISAAGDKVFVACRAPVGYGYDVWRTSLDFADGEKIVTGLSGCCGQMDVQACDAGVFVAENSRHRVCHYDASGSLVTTFGKGAQEGVEGFGSCCNPMNLAFGPGGVLYTAEDTTGRIKRYKPDGTLLSVVGSADVVPGCKKVAIGVDATGDRVFMLDITRNHIAVLSRVAPDPTAPIADAAAAAEEPSAAGGLLRLLGIGS